MFTLFFGGVGVDDKPAAFFGCKRLIHIYQHIAVKLKGLCGNAVGAKAVVNHRHGVNTIVLQVFVDFKGVHAYFTVVIAAYAYKFVV